MTALEVPGSWQQGPPEATPTISLAQESLSATLSRFRLAEGSLEASVSFTSVSETTWNCDPTDLYLADTSGEDTRAAVDDEFRQACRRPLPQTVVEGTIRFELESDAHPLAIGFRRGESAPISLTTGNPR